MKVLDLLKKESIVLNAKPTNVTEAIKLAVSVMNESGNINDLATYEAGVFAREEESTTAVGNFIAIPHCKSDAVSAPGLVALKLNEGIDWKSLDGNPVKLVFLIAAPNSEDNVHLHVLAKLSRMLVHDDFVEKLMNAQTADEFAAVIQEYDV